MHPYFSLPGIRSLAYVSANRLSNNLVMQALAQVPIAIYLPQTPIEFTGECTCIVETTNEYNGITEVATLTFLTQMELPSDQALAFVITDVMGNVFLLGAKEEPFPLVTSSKSFGLPDGEVSAHTVEVVHKSQKALIPCLSALS